MIEDYIERLSEDSQFNFSSYRRASYPRELLDRLQKTATTLGARLEYQGVDFLIQPGVIIEGNNYYVIEPTTAGSITDPVTGEDIYFHSMSALMLEDSGRVGMILNNFRKPLRPIKDKVGNKIIVSSKEQLSDYLGSFFSRNRSIIESDLSKGRDGVLDAVRSATEVALNRMEIVDDPNFINKFNDFLSKTKNGYIPIK